MARRLKGEGSFSKKIINNHEYIRYTVTVKVEGKSKRVYFYGSNETECKRKYKEWKQKQAANPDWTADEIKRAGQQALTAARAKVGASKSNVQVDITDKEWEAIQAGAISTSKLEQILNNADSDKVKQLASPKKTVTVNASQAARIKSMINFGYTQAEVAEATGLSVSTINKYL